MKRDNQILKLKMEGQTVIEIGNKFNLTHQRVSQILKKLNWVRKFKEPASIICKTCGITFKRYTNKKVKFCGRGCFLERKDKLTTEEKRLRNTIRQRKYIATERGGIVIRKILKKTTEKYAYKQRARKIFNYHIRKGNIIRPKICEICSKENIRIEAHHEDYSKPLQVKFVCSLCHKSLHKK